MGLISLIRGFRLSISDFDRFLTENGLPPLGGGYQPSHEEMNSFAKLFSTKGIACEVKIFVPFVTGFNRSEHLFVCCDWIHVLASSEIEGVLQKPIPPTFEELRNILKAKSLISRYIVYNEEDSASFLINDVI
ncbi:hypothetical protein GQ44DRAFT_765278 [Phaeosphaeriaceae sp. PMI808]|nr:hypothetical protein GQ44DRAFT_765278 [Phaeosphaeriaceae sp. PMI808]